MRLAADELEASDFVTVIDSANSFNRYWASSRGGSSNGTGQEKVLQKLRLR